jgi:hypothetical protein
MQRMGHTLSQIQAWNVDHLVEAADHWTATADRWESAFAEVHQQVHAVAWKGAGADAARDRATFDKAHVASKGDQLREAASVARRGAGDIAAAQRRMMYAVEDAQNAKFTVSEDLSVTDKLNVRNSAKRAARQAQAQAFAADIRQRATQLAALDAEVAANITAAAGNVGTTAFPGRVQPVDNTIHTHPHDDPFNEHIDPPPYKAPAGKEWHWYTGATGWKLEDPLKQCSGGDEFWYTAEFIGGIVGTVFYGPLGMIAVGHAAHDITHCTPPGS